MRLVAIVPTYRNLRTLPTVLEELEAGGLPLIVIDDGSDDGTGPWLDAWVAERGGRVVEHLPTNRGKGAALEAGLARARAEGFDHALTVDSDGQHLVEDAMRMVSAAEEGVLLVGARDEGAGEAVGKTVGSYPPRSMFGRRLWALGVRSLTGLGVADPICGLRVYPLGAIASVGVSAGRYAWEEEFLVRAAWAGVVVREIGIRAVYQPEGERVSHFALGDWFESLGTWARLAGLRLVGRSPRHRPRGPLVRCDRSWRRLVGAAAFVGCSFGAVIPWFVALPLFAWIAWRLHAPILAAWLGVLVGGLVGVLANSLTDAWSSVMLAGVVSVVLSGVSAALLAIVVTRAARFRGSS